ncbi:ATP-binding cassette domain-containing protein [Listeria sp. FSL L7-0091]|uniref:ATP-binding cassette domain-containing protein n=1 Tax=Listeria farberi TaxID=2713500 RepID=UPI0016279694|nr:ATP-binding cassette domain-containing protein [Listeria farberi]MBC1967389.1 ATP-binding cassette domain-containing protein [Listeria welshimeri]MBC2262684.1 ATP-binding cassette domain-containing protein [Listeria farberi]MBC2268054.1 ATP-binding cassette domain-containing protein [Listeria farberi]
MIELVNVSKKIKDKLILKKVSLSIGTGEFIAIVGESGSGKTTLLNIIGHLEAKDSGQIKINHTEYHSKKEIMVLKKEILGFIFQNYLLMENETVQDNLSISKGTDRNLMIKYLDYVGLDESYLLKKVYQLSGGEKQRIAIVRILLKPFQLLLADEPTGNLDNKNKQKIIELFLELKKQGKTIICVTHDPEISGKADRVIHIEKGEIR